MDTGDTVTKSIATSLCETSRIDRVADSTYVQQLHAVLVPAPAGRMEWMCHARAERDLEHIHYQCGGGSVGMTFVVMFGSPNEYDTDQNGKHGMLNTKITSMDPLL